jgi:hypothetical protein
VTVEMVVANLRQNVATAQEVIRRVVPAIAGQADWGCACQSALASSLITAREHIPVALRQRLGLLVDKYLP